MCSAQVYLLNAFDVFNDVKQDASLHLRYLTQLSALMKVEHGCL